MDGDTRRMKQYDQSHFATRSGMTRRAVPRASGGAGATDRFRQSGLQQARGDALAQTTTGARPRIPTYLEYGYTDAPFHGGSLQGDDLQPYAPTLRDQQRQLHQVQQPFTPYESEMVYNLSPQGPTQSPYEVVPPYPARQSAAMEALSSQFAVPQYFSPNEPTGAGVPAVGSPYLTPQLSLSYNQPGPIGRSNTTHSFPATMTDMNPVGTTGRLEQSSPSHQQQQQQQTQQVQQQQQQATQQAQQQQQQAQAQPPQQEGTDSPNLTEAYGQSQGALRGTFDHTRAGRLVEASRSLLEISEWLVTNARELGILRDDQVPYTDRLQLWNQFNLCWLAVCQKQKDLMQDLLQTGHRPPHCDLLSNDGMENLAKKLIQLCDELEGYGLVDYQMGIWEEEILSVLGQCLDLMESRPEVVRAHTMTAPATATSRS